MEVFISTLLFIVALYLVLGFIFTIVFLFKGLSKVDPLTIDVGAFFKLLIIPGLVVFWLIFLRKWLKHSST